MNTKPSKSQFNIKLSKSLSWLLRHGAREEHLELEDGYLSVDKILTLKQFKSYSLKDVITVVETNDKQRFSLREHPDTRQLQIRANQGHSIPVDEACLLCSLDEETLPNDIIHGTYQENWKIISNQGISKMKRNHIHFATGLPGESGVISGMRKNCEVYIMIDGKKAIRDGMKFYKSANNVILCSGDEHGILKPLYFQEVWQISPKKRLL